MFNLLYAEIIKLKKCYIVFVIIACSILMPILSFIRYLIFLPKVSLEYYISLNEVLMFVLIIIMVTTLLSSYIFLREYIDNSIKVLYSYPISKISIFISKILVIYIIIFLVYILHFIFLFGGGLILYKEGLLIRNMVITNKFLFMHVNMYLKSMILLFSIVPILVFITNMFKNYIVTVIVGAAGAIINLFMLQSKWYGFCPFILPTLPFEISFINYSINHSINIVNTIGLALSWFIAGIVLCIYQFLKLEEL